MDRDRDSTCKQALNGDRLKTDRIGEDPFFPFFIGTMPKKSGLF